MIKKLYSGIVTQVVNHRGGQCCGVGVGVTRSRLFRPESEWSRSRLNFIDSSTPSFVAYSHYHKQDFSKIWSSNSKIKAKFRFLRPLTKILKFFFNTLNSKGKNALYFMQNFS